MDLDKDLLCKDSREYSPETCSFITHYLNTVFEDRGIKQRLYQKELIEIVYFVSKSNIMKRKLV